MLNTGDVVYFAHRTPGYGVFGLIERLRSWRLRVTFDTWMWALGSGFFFVFMLRLYVTGHTADGMLIPFVAVWSVLLLIKETVRREKPDEMSEAAYSRAARCSHAILFAAMWLLLLLLAVGDRVGVVMTRALAMLLISGALFAACTCRACVFSYHVRRGFENDRAGTE